MAFPKDIFLVIPLLFFHSLTPLLVNDLLRRIKSHGIASQRCCMNICMCAFLSYLLQCLPPSPPPCSTNTSIAEVERFAFKYPNNLWSFDPGCAQIYTKCSRTHMSRLLFQTINHNFCGPATRNQNLRSSRANFESLWRFLIHW